MRRRLKLLPWLLCTAALFLLPGCGSTESQETAEDEEAPALPLRPPQKLRIAPEYKAVEGTEGAMKQATLYAGKIPSLKAALEVRSLVLLPRKALLPADRETLYEVLRGDVESESGGDRKTHGAGDLWVVSRGVHITVKAKGEVAVLRAISLAGK